MLNQIRHVFTYDYFQLTPHSHSKRVFKQWTDATTIALDELNVDVRSYPSPFSIPTTDVPVLALFSVIPLFFLRYHAGVVTSWHFEALKWPDPSDPL